MKKDKEKEMICIVCPVGCRMKVQEKDGEIIVEGNSCPRGKKYAIDEFKSPKRMLTTSVSVTGGEWPLVSVKTGEAIPKDSIEKALCMLTGVEMKAPVEIGDVVLKDIAGTGTDVVATRRVDAV